MIGIISAMPEEIKNLLENLQNKTSLKKGMRTYYRGLLFNKPVVLVFSRWGKVAAATTVTQLINDFDVEQIIFTGVAGSIQENINIGDIVIGKNLYQHDMDASPLVDTFEIPLLHKKYFETSLIHRKKLFSACQLFIEDIENYISKNDRLNFKIEAPKIFTENIASGDQFVSSDHQLKYIKTKLPNIACVEMEGAAIAQVCFEYKVPFTVIRTISDKANDNSDIDFPKFANQIASNYALGILKYYLKL